MVLDNQNQLPDEYYMSVIMRSLKYIGALSIHNIFNENKVTILQEPHRKQAIATLCKPYSAQKIVPTFPINSLRSIRLQSTFYNRVKACPTCLKQYGYLKTDWLDLYATYCKEHNCSLITNCNECGEELKWDIPLLSGKCSNFFCNRPLKPQKNDLSTLSKEQIEDLLIATILLTKDIHKIVPQHKYFPVGNVISEMNKTLSILNNQEASEKTTLHNSIYPKNIQDTWFNLVMTSMQNRWPLFRISNTNSASFIASNEEPVLMNLSEITREFGLTNDDCTILEKTNLIEKVNSHLLCHYEQNYDVSPIFKSLNTYSTRIATKKDCTEASEPIPNLVDYINTRRLLETLLIERKINYNYTPRHDLFNSLKLFL